MNIKNFDIKEEDKRFLIKDLCARLPYKPTIRIESLDSILRTYISHLYMNVIDAINHVEIKPYLFPLSSMTEEQKAEYYDVCRNDWIDNKAKDIEDVEVLYKGADWLNAHHFDYRGLIDKGLALDATNLNIY